MISFLDSLTENLSSQPTSDWWAICGAKGSKRSFLFVICRATVRSGTVWDPTDEQVAAAEGPGDYKFPWTDESRIVLDVKKGGQGE